MTDAEPDCFNGRQSKGPASLKVFWIAEAGRQCASHSIQPRLAFPVRVYPRRAGDRRPFYVPHGRYEAHIARIDVLEQTLGSAVALSQYFGRPLDKVVGEPLIVSKWMLPLPKHQPGEKFSLEQARKAVRFLRY
jgi:hypothetical protein